MNGCQGTPWSEELDGRERHGAASGDLEPRQSAVSCTPSTQRQDINPTNIYECGIMLFLGGDVSYVFSLLPDYLFPRGLCFRTYGFENIACPKPCITLLSHRVLFFQGGLSPRTRAAIICSGRLNWWEYYHLNPHNHLSRLCDAVCDC